jgi:hypothetical protein
VKARNADKAGQSDYVEQSIKPGWHDHLQLVSSKEQFGSARAKADDSQIAHNVSTIVADGQKDPADIARYRRGLCVLASPNMRQTSGMRDCSAQP